MDDNDSSGAPRRLARLFGLDERGRHLWQADELSHILAHQLSTPLFFDTSRLTAVTVGGQSLRSFGDLFRHPSPPLDLLRLTKEFAKASDDRVEDPLPPEIATVLYYGVIAVALVRHGQRISSLDDGRLREGIEWVLGQPWVDSETRRVFAEAAGVLREGGAPPRPFTES
jgi:hypothetical protein